MIFLNFTQYKGNSGEKLNGLAIEIIEFSLHADLSAPGISRVTGKIIL